MQEKQRSLPSWMTKKEETKKDLPRSRRKRKTASAVFYCMNEKELVEAAISVLHDAPRKGAVPPRGRQGAPTHNVLPPNFNEAEESVAETTEKEKEKCSTSKKTENEVMEEGQSSDYGHAEDATCISETDQDIAELETLPYTSSPPRPVGQRSGPAQDRHDPQGGGPEEEGNAQTAAEEEEDDEDSLQLVREIFFR